MTQPSDMQKVARLSDLASGMKRVDVNGTPIVLIRSGKAVHAYGAECPHAGAPLEQGALCDDRLVCPWHKATFDIASGAIIEPPALLPLTRYPVQLAQDDVLVSSTPEPQPNERAATASVSTSADKRTFAIIGAGAAGAAACSALREFGFAGRIVLIDREPRTPYDRTVLSKFVPSGEMPPDDIPLLLPGDFFATHSIDVIQADVTALDADARRIDIGSAPSIRYDAALVATGGVPKRPSLQGIDDDGVAQRIRLLRNRDDARRLVETAAQSEHAVVLGASFIGLEVASALRERKVRVTIVSPGDVPFEKQFGPDLGRLFMRLHDAHGVRFRMGRRAQAVERNDTGDGVLRVTLDNRDTLSCDFIVVGMGVTPATGFIEGVTRNDDGSLDADASMRVADGLYAAGDVARFELQALGGERVRIEHWRVAQQHARLAARAMLGLPAGEPLVPFFWTYHFGKNFNYLGHARHWDDTIFTGTPDTFEFIALLAEKGRLVAAVGCNRDRQIGALGEAMRKPLDIVDAIRLAQSE
ncbi:FAD-dependent oxidoreductase [Paraburkholderia diazotrophica]|uniref:FAD-dependent oxidoreductase n=1 Tax=Paraburkholderia diazotrophica TaxID=667676 RepID=UPI0031749A61